MANWGGSKRALSALWPEITVRVESGCTLRNIYEELSRSGNLSLSIASFYRSYKALSGTAARSSGQTTALVSVPSPMSPKHRKTPAKTTPEIRSLAAELPARARTLEQLWGDEEPDEEPAGDDPDAPTPASSDDDKEQRT